MGKDEQARTLGTAYFDYSVEFCPELASFLGIHTFDNRLSSYGKSTLDYHVRKLREFNRQAQDLLSSRELSVSSSIDVRIVASLTEIQALEIERMRRPWTDPTLYVEMALYGLFLLASRDVLPVDKRARSIASRLRELGRVLSEAKENLENPPRVFTTTALEMLRGARSFISETASHLAKEAPTVAGELESASEAGLAAVSRFEDYLQHELLPRSTGDFAIGKTMFDRKLKIEHMLELDTQGLEKNGRELLARTREQIQTLSQEAHPGKDWKDVIEELKGNHPSAKELREAYRTHMKAAKEFVLGRNLVPVPPGEDLRVIDTPSFERATIPYAAYVSPGAFDAKQEGLFFVTPIDETAAEELQDEQLQGHSYPSIVLTSLHEGYPGHHLQLIHSNRVRSKVRQLCGNTVFAEGWALYCEELMKEKGFYRSKDVELFQLKDMLWRAARVVVDVGLHTKTMSFEDAVEFLITEALIERPNAIAEVRRYTNTPTQPSSYAVGKTEVLALRDEEERRLGAQFNLSDFHAKLLSSGTLPFKLVREEFMLQG